MRYFASSASPIKQKTGCIIVGVYPGGKLSPAAKLVDDATGGVLTRLAKRGDLPGRNGQTRSLLDVSGCAAQRVMLVGLGKQTKLDDKLFRRAHDAACIALLDSGAKSAVSCLGETHPEPDNLVKTVRQCVEGLEARLYRFDECKSKAKRSQPHTLKEFGFAVSGRAAVNKAQASAKQGAAIAAGSALARDLGNRPANVCTPSHLALQAKKLATDYKNITTQVLSEAQMKRLGMGALLSVTAGASEPAKLIVMHYKGAPASKKPYALVGKGITFDTGGISIKPAAAMDEMKYDMGGAASVIGTFLSLAKLNLPINVVGVVAACENMPSGTATKPGDIVTSMSGLTIEVLNTDAEGRLVLCDALTYVQKFKPRAIIDVATLTGACVIALGHHLSGLMSPDDALAADLLAASETSGDGAWRMPVDDEYFTSLESNFADFANVGGRAGGAITAACFLAQFTKSQSWAHLDVAGTAWTSGKNKGASGRPVPLLSQYLIDRS